MSPLTFWLDSHLDPELPAWLGATFGVIAKSLVECGLRDADDDVLFDAARRLGPNIVVMTKDWDFGEFVRRRRAPPQVVHLRMGNTATIRMRIRLSAAFPEALRRLEAGEEIVEVT